MLPWASAKTPALLRTVAATEATDRIIPCTIGVSSWLGHGTATRGNKTGNARCRSHAVPPAHQVARRQSPATSPASSQLTKRQSRLPSCTKRVGPRASSNPTARHATKAPPGRGIGAGRFCHRFQKAHAPRRGTIHP